MTEIKGREAVAAQGAPQGVTVLLLLWTDPGSQTVVAFTAQLLSEHGCRVHILCRRVSAEEAYTGDMGFGSNTTVHPIGRGVGAIGRRNKIEYPQFLWRARAMVRDIRPDWVIGYNAYGCVAAYLACKAGHGGPAYQSQDPGMIYQNLDLSPLPGLDPFRWVLNTLELAGARRADSVLVASEGRAAILKERARLQREPIVVKTCQRLALAIEPTGELRRLLRSQGLEFDRLVVRLGSLGPGHGIEATIRSVSSWQGKWGLVLAGTASSAYLETLRDLVTQLSLTERVVLLPHVPYALLYDCLDSADLGIALYEPGNINHASMAGAGTKLNMYMKAGIPSIVPNLPDFIALLGSYPVGAVADPADPASIASAVNSILSHPERYAEYCRAAEAAFKAEFNFEKQFEPVLAMILGRSAACKQGKAVLTT